MKLLLSLFATGCLFAGGAFAAQLNGYISDAHCKTMHSSVSAANTKCIKKCLRSGIDPVLVRNGKVFTFDQASEHKAAKHAGQEVKINGTENGTTIHIKSIKKT
ncbi:MAG: hypothetical protein ACRD45_08555 [Bryobacteraceae bacterium]